MKYLLATILLAASMSTYASNAENSIRHKIICKEGHKFLVSWTESGTWRPPTVVQIYETAIDFEGAPAPAQPMRCNK